MNFLPRTITIFIVTSLLVWLDQATKIFAFEYLPKGNMTSYFYDLFRIGYTENIGAFLGLGNNLSEQTRFWLFVVVIGLFLSALLCYLLFNAKQQLHSVIALSLMFSGGVSNFYDRVVNHGAVVDFMNIGVGSIRTGIFNVADIAIMLGVLMLILQMKSKAE